MSKKTTVFISYRTDDSAEFARNLQHFIQVILKLPVHLGEDTLPGEEWEKKIPQLISRSDIFIAVIGNKWEKPDSNDVKHDINNPQDIVRKEVELGLKKVGHFGIIMLDGLKLKADKLPPSLQTLPTLQWVSASREFQTGDGIGKLTAKIHELCDMLKPKPIVLLSSTLAFLGNKETTDGLTYFVTLVMSLVHRIMGPEREIILKVPPYGGSQASKTAAQFQCELLDEILENKERYSGIIIAPFSTASLRSSLVKLARKDPVLPIITIDKTYHSEADIKFFEDEGMQPPAGVACNGEYNGDLAAKCVRNHIESAKVDKPNVVVLQGLEGSEDRIRGFINYIIEYNASQVPDRRIHINVSHEMEFLGDKAKEVANSYLNPHSQWELLSDQRYESLLAGQPAKRRNTVDVFFCCNDEMALGVCEALEIKFQQNELHSTVVVGFDGIPETVQKIAHEDHWLLNTVDVKVEVQVKTLVDRFLQAIQSHTSMTGIDLVKGHAVVNDQPLRTKSLLAWRDEQRRRLD